MKPYLAQIKSNIRLMVRDRSVLVFSYMFPLVFFFLFAQVYDARQSAAVMAQVFSMVLVIGVLGNGFFGAGMRSIQDRETNVLRRFKVAPIGPGPIIVSALVSGLISFLPTILLFLLFSSAIYHMPVPPNVVSMVIFVSIAVLAFRSMGTIIAATVNSAQEGGILAQVLYLPMMFLSGATFPISIMPHWVQTIAQFMPATYLFQGMQSIMIAGQGLGANLVPIAGLLITLVVGFFVAVKLFRWEKEEKVKNGAKLWIVAVLSPFVVMGVYQARTQENVEKSKALFREAMRNRTLLYQNARIFVGDGRLIANGAVLIKAGKIAKVFDNPPSDTKGFDAEVIDASGKTIIPGLIDMHVHIGAPGGVFSNQSSYADPNAGKRRLAAYLYSGITAVRSTGDFLDASLQLRKTINAGNYLGAELFACGPLFTAEGGHPTELLKSFPSSMRQTAKEQFVRLPKSAEEARNQVDALKSAGVDCIKSVLESGNAEWGVFNHLDAAIYRAIQAEAHKQNLPTATHTGGAADVLEAVDAGSNTIEHGSIIDPIPAATFAEMKTKDIAYDPTLSVYEGMAASRSGNAALLTRSLVQQVGPADLLSATRAQIVGQKNPTPPEHFKPILDTACQNLTSAWKAGVTLIAGSDAGNMLVIHGPTIQHELELWVKSGIPPAIALQAATLNAAKALRADQRIGSIQPGRDATLVILDGDPLEDISNTERIATVMFRGERIDRSELFNQDKQ